MSFPKEVEMSYNSTHGETCYVSDTQAPISLEPWHTPGVSSTSPPGG